jgi:hypothetical protein
MDPHLFIAELRVWWAQMLVAYAEAACRHGGNDGLYLSALKAAREELDAAVRAADKMRKG